MRGVFARRQDVVGILRQILNIGALPDHQNRIADLQRQLAHIGVIALSVPPKRHRQQARIAVKLHV